MGRTLPLLCILAFNSLLTTAQSVVNKDVVVVQYDDNDKYRFNEGLCAVQRNQRWGFIDTTGKVVIDFLYCSNGYEQPIFREGKCCVCIQSEQDDLKRLYIDKTGNVLFPNYEFSGITPFSGGFAIVELTNQSGSSTLALIDSLGRSPANAVLPGYSPGMKLEFRGFHEGLAAVCDAKTNAWGFINWQGVWAIQPERQYKYVCNFHDGMALIQEAEEGKWGAINSKGELVIPFIYPHKPADFSEGLAAVRNLENKVGYIDKTGNLVIPYYYEPITNQNGLPFFEGNTLVSRDGFYYSISITGKETMKIGDATLDVQMLQNGLVTFKKWLNKEYWGIGLMRTNGELLKAPGMLYQLSDFGNGLAHAKAKINGINFNGFVNLDTNFVILNENQ